MKHSATITCPITRVVERDDGSLVVHGRLAEQKLDKYGKVFDYDASKPHFEAWRDEIRGRSGGKSDGNVRVMHQLWPAGKVVPGGLEFDDEARVIDATAEITEPDAVRMVLDGLLHTFSWAGSDAQPPWRAADGRMHMAIKPHEMSLVDNPGCILDGKGFEIMRADGSTEHRAFREVPMLSAAVRGKLAVLRDRVDAVSARAIGARVPGTAPIVRGLWTVSRFAELLDCLKGLALETGWERDAEDDGSPIPDRLGELVVLLGDVLVAMTEEEVGELVAEYAPAAGAAIAMAATDTAAATEGSAAARAAGAGGGAEEGIDMTKEELTTLLGTQREEIVRALGPQVGEQVSRALEPVQTVITEQADLLKTQGEQLTEMRAAQTAQDARLATLEAAPAAPKGVTRAVTRDGDGDRNDGPEAFNPKDKKPLEVMRAIVTGQRFIEGTASA